MNRPRAAIRRLRACTRGAAAVEFAIVSGVLIMLLVGILDLGRALWAQNQISYLADQAVRRILIEPDIDEAALETDLLAGFSAGNPAALEFSVSPETVDGKSYRVVSIDFPFALLIPNIGVDALTLGVTRRVPAD